MSDFATKMKSLKLPSWMNRGEPARLLKAAVKFWTGIVEWVTWPLQQFDPLTCAEPLLNLLAYDRDIARFNGEPLALFRKRVAYAFINAQDAGSVSGFIAIFERLGIGTLSCWTPEGIDWDYHCRGPIANFDNEIYFAVIPVGRTAAVSLKCLTRRVRIAPEAPAIVCLPICVVETGPPRLAQSSRKKCQRPSLR